MEHKIGEIFEYKGEWYQCVKGNTCDECSFNKSSWNCSFDGTPYCSDRSDEIEVIFKKLEKVGEPYEYYVSKKGIIQVQDYLLADPNHTVYNKIEGVYDYLDGKVVIEIKQTNEDMEENKLNLKPFDIQKAKEGKPVCTRDGRKARIICFDVKAKKPIAALITNDDTEEVHFYYDNGRSDQYQKYRYDLMMFSEKKKRWVNVMEGTAGKVYVGNNIYRTEDEAKEGASRFTSKLIANVPIEWEE